MVVFVGGGGGREAMKSRSGALLLSLPAYGSLVKYERSTEAGGRYGAGSAEC